MLFDVNYSDGIYYARDKETGKWLVIEKSVSFLYVKVVHENGQQDFQAVTFDTHFNVLSELRNYLYGKQYTNMELLENVCLRSGWYDARLSGLSFTPILDILKRYRAKKIQPKDRYRMALIAKQLSVSMRDIYLDNPSVKFSYV